MAKKPELICPNCGTNGNISRIEALFALARVQPDEKKGWTYAGESEVEWDTQSRELVPKGTPEFFCGFCTTQFNLEEKNARKEKPVRHTRRNAKGD